MQRQLGVVRKLLAQACQLPVHLERDEERALGVVLVADRGAEERQERVAGELLDVALVTADDAAQATDHRIDDLEQLLWVEPVGEGGKPRDVREERSDEAAFLRNLSPSLDEPVRDRLRDEAAERLGYIACENRFSRGNCRGPAVAAEAHPFRVLAAARRTHPAGHVRPSVGLFSPTQARLCGFGEAAAAVRIDVVVARIAMLGLVRSGGRLILLVAQWNGEGLSRDLLELNVFNHRVHWRLCSRRQDGARAGKSSRPRFASALSSCLCVRLARSTPPGASPPVRTQRQVGDVL